MDKHGIDLRQSILDTWNSFLKSGGCDTRREPPEWPPMSSREAEYVAITYESLSTLTGFDVNWLLMYGAQMGWSGPTAIMPDGEKRALDLDTVEPGLRLKIIQAARAAGEPLHNVVLPVPNQVIDSARNEVRSNKTVSIHTVRLAVRVKPE